MVLRLPVFVDDWRTQQKKGFVWWQWLLFPLLWYGPWGTCRWCYPANTLRLGNLLPRYHLELIQINRATKLDKLDFLIGHSIVVLKHVACLKLAIWIWNRAQKRIGEKLNLTIDWIVWCASNWFSESQMMMHFLRRWNLTLGVLSSCCNATNNQPCWCKSTSSVENGGFWCSLPPTPRKRKKNISKYLCDDKFLPQSPQTDCD